MDLRREFKLPAEDVACLDEYGCPWEAVKDGPQWVLIHDFPVPEGYNVGTVSAAIRIETGYPMAPLDMVFFHPALARVDGTQIKATQVVQTIDGKQYQRWSRHRTKANPWKPGEDSLATHLVLVEDWLEREFGR
jgi:hypothetical protein